MLILVPITNPNCFYIISFHKRMEIKCYFMVSSYLTAWKTCHQKTCHQAHWLIRKKFKPSATLKFDLESHEHHHMNAMSNTAEPSWKLDSSSRWQKMSQMYVTIKMQPIWSNQRNIKWTIEQQSQACKYLKCSSKEK